jgi:hypothetical protein
LLSWISRHEYTNITSPFRDDAMTSSTNGWVTPESRMTEPKTISAHTVAK